MTVSVILFSVFISIIAGFQIALALGAPLGEFTLAGKFPGKLPPKMRIAALIQLLLLGVFEVIILSKAGIIFESFYSFSNIAIWFIVGFSALSSVINFTSPSKKERIWGPVSIILFVSSIIIALA
jgi:hypothetical protein